MPTTTNTGLGIDRIDTAADQLGRENDKNYRQVALFHLAHHIDDINHEHNTLTNAGTALWTGGQTPTPEWVLECYADDSHRRSHIFEELQDAILGDFTPLAGHLLTYLWRLERLWMDLPTIHQGELPRGEYGSDRLQSYQRTAEALVWELKAAQHLLEEGDDD